MKPDIHPDYHPVVFQDATTGAMFLTRSTFTGSRTIEWQSPDGAHTYPLVVVEVTSDSHPFWTGGRRIVDTAGQVEKFPVAECRMEGGYRIQTVKHSLAEFFRRFFARLPTRLDRELIRKCQTIRFHVVPSRQKPCSSRIFFNLSSIWKSLRANSSAPSSSKYHVTLRLPAASTWRDA